MLFGLDLALRDQFERREILMASGLEGTWSASVAMADLEINKSAHLPSC